jgi:hypothetical protein
MQNMLEPPPVIPAGALLLNHPINLAHGLRRHQPRHSVQARSFLLVL